MYLPKLIAFLLFFVLVVFVLPVSVMAISAFCMCHSECIFYDPLYHGNVDKKGKATADPNGAYLFTTSEDIYTNVYCSLNCLTLPSSLPFFETIHKWKTGAHSK